MCCQCHCCRQPMRLPTSPDTCRIHRDKLIQQCDPVRPIHQFPKPNPTIPFASEPFAPSVVSHRFEMVSGRAANCLHAFQLSADMVDPVHRIAIVVLLFRCNQKPNEWIKILDIRNAERYHLPNGHTVARLTRRNQIVLQRDTQ